MLVTAVKRTTREQFPLKILAGKLRHLGATAAEKWMILQICSGRFGGHRRAVHVSAMKEYRKIEKDCKLQ